MNNRTQFSLAVAGVVLLFSACASPTGTQGEQGPPGPQGPAGATGATGAMGTMGTMGETGAMGTTGTMGTMGTMGLMGDAGPAGPQGAVGPAGPQGDAGPQGPAGPQGDVGPIGPAGPQGDVGPIGPAGPQGDVGPRGDVGPIGPAGPQGDVGPRGDVGPAGSYLIDAGSGLALSSGSLSLASCPTGQVLKSTASGWACSADAVNVYTAGSGLELVDGAFSVAASAVTNAMLQNPVIMVSMGPGLSATTDMFELGGSVTISNSGVLDVSAQGPLSSSGGQNPRLSLGTVPVSMGGTGATTAAGALNNLEAAPATGSPNYIQNQTFVAQAASINITGTMRMGNETGTSEPPDYPGTGMIHRRVRTTLSTDGGIVAMAGSIQLERDGTTGGFKVENTHPATSPNIKCFVMNNAGTVSGKMATVGPSSTVPLFDTSENIVMMDCQVQYSHTNAFIDHAMTVQLSRTSFGNGIWSGFVTSTTNQ